MAGSVISAVLTLKDKNFTSNAKKANKQLTDTERKTQHAKNQMRKFGKSAARNMKKAAKVTGIAGSAMAGLGGAAFTATSKVADSINDIAVKSEKMGTSVLAFQEFDYWAQQNDLSSQQLEKGIGRLNQRMGKAKEGNEKYASALEDLGVDMDEVKNGSISTANAFSTSIKKLSEMENKQEAAGKASELFGTKLARDLMPAIKEGSMSIKEAKKEAYKMGAIIGEDTVEQAQKFSATFDRLKTSAKTFGMSALSGMMPFFQKIMDFAVEKMPAVQSAITGAFSKIGSVIGWFRDKGKMAFDAIKESSNNTKPILESLKDAAKGIGNVLKTAFDKAQPAIDWFVQEGIPGAVNIVRSLIDKVKTVYHFIVDNWSKFGPIITGVVGALATYKAAMIAVSTVTKTWSAVTNAAKLAQSGLNAVMRANPIGIVITALTGLITAGVALYQNWDTVKEKAVQLWSTVKEKFLDLKNKVVGFFGKMKDSAVNKFNSIVDWTKKLPGRIGGAIINFAGAAYSKVKSFGISVKDKAVNMFLSLVDWTKGLPGRIGGAIINFAGEAYGKVTSFAGSIKDKIVSKFKDIVGWAKDLPGKIGSGIKGAAHAVKSGAKSLGEKLLNPITGAIDGIAHGLGWVLKKVGATDIGQNFKNFSAMDLVPGYAQGVGGHPTNGPAIVGDGKGSNAGSELITRPNGESFLSPDKPTLMPMEKGTQVTPAKTTREMFDSFPAYANGIGGWLKTAWGKTKGFFEKTGEVIAHPIKAAKGAISKFVDTDGMSGMMTSMVKGMVDTVVTKGKDWLKEKIGLGGSKDAPSGKGVQRWAPQVKKALAANNLSTSQSMVNTVLRQISTESGGNPKAVQGPGVWDINMAQGNPAKGLMQTIPDTFNAYKFPGHGNIFNGYDNLLAALNYAKTRYGKNLSFLGQGHGYRRGTNYVPEDQPAYLHKGEAVVPARYNNTGSHNENTFYININGQDKTIHEIVNELVPELKSRLANM